MSQTRTALMCPNCGESLRRANFSDGGDGTKRLCDDCEQAVDPVTDRDDTAMEFKALHRIRCEDCWESPQLLGLHMGEKTDRVVVGCRCFTIDAVPYELAEPELPLSWEIVHGTVFTRGEDL